VPRPPGRLTRRTRRRPRTTSEPLPIRRSMGPSRPRTEPLRPEGSGGPPRPGDGPAAITAEVRRVPALPPPSSAWRGGGWRPTPGRRTGRGLLGAGRYPRLRGPGGPGWWWPAWPRPPTGGTAPAGSSPVTGRGTGCSGPCTGPASPTQPESVSRDDGAAPGRRLGHRRRCAAPRRPTSRPITERDTCAPYLVRELGRAGPGRDRGAGLLRLPRPSGGPARRGRRLPTPRPRFGHAVGGWATPGPLILCSFHPQPSRTPSPGSLIRGDARPDLPPRPSPGRPLIRPPAARSGRRRSPPPPSPAAGLTLSAR